MTKEIKIKFNTLYLVKNLDEDRVVYTLEGEGEKAIKIRRWRVYDDEKLKRIRKNEEEYRNQFPRAPERKIFRGNWVSGVKEVFYLPKSQIKFNSRSVELPRWLGKKYGLDLLKEV